MGCGAHVKRLCYIHGQYKEKLLTPQFTPITAHTGKRPRGSDDYVINEVDLNCLCCSNNIFSHGNICATGGWIASGVVMHHNGFDGATH